MALRCTVCDHPKIVEINETIIGKSGTGPGQPGQIRDIADKYRLSKSAVSRHKLDCLPRVIQRAAQRQVAKTDDQFIEAIQMLMQESAQYVTDAHGAVKVQQVGKGEYKEYRDVGAMAGAINAARSVTELLGHATGRLNQAGPAAGGNVYLSVILPRALEQQPSAPELPAIDVQALPDPPTDS